MAEYYYHSGGALPFASFADMCAHYDKLYPSAAAPPDRVCSSRLGLSEQNAETQKCKSTNSLSVRPSNRDFNVLTHPLLACIFTSIRSGTLTSRICAEPSGL